MVVSTGDNCDKENSGKGGKRDKCKRRISWRFLSVHDWRLPGRESRGLVGLSTCSLAWSSSECVVGRSSSAAEEEEGP